MFKWKQQQEGFIQAILCFFFFGGQIKTKSNNGQKSLQQDVWAAMHSTDARLNFVLFCFFSLQLINLPQKLGIRNQNKVINHRHVFCFFVFFPEGLIYTLTSPGCFSPCVSLSSHAFQQPHLPRQHFPGTRSLFQCDIGGTATGT